MKLAGSSPKQKKLWDDSHRSLDQHLAQNHPAEDSISIEDYMNRWCNAIQTKNSPTPKEDYRTPRLFSPKERDNLEKYNKFINELSVRIEGGWPPADHIPHDSHMTKTFFDILSDPLKIRTKSLKETDSHYNPIRTRRSNPTRSRLPQSIQKEIGSPQTKERGNNSQKMKNYRSSKAFRSKKTTSRKFPITIAKFSWPSFRIKQTERPNLCR